MLLKLNVMDITKKSQLFAKHGKHFSSAFLRNNAVVCHKNPVLQDCVIDGMLVSDLYLGLRLKDQDAINLLSNTERNTRYGRTFARHMSAEDYRSIVTSTTAAIDDLAASAASESPASESPASESPASDSNEA